jgi:hypothetical protein
MIHTFGDSHSVSPWNGIPGIRTHHFIAKLCYSVGRDGIHLDQVNNGDTVIFCFGEIDCRCHVKKHVVDDYRTIIDPIVDRYFERIREATQGRQLRIAVFNVVPPVQIANLDPKYVASAVFGSDEERKSYVLYFNQKLKEGCEKNNFIFFDVYDKYCDENGFLARPMTYGDVHIGDPCYVKEFLDQISLKNASI